MLCALSGNQTSDAVVSPKSGGIFDRKLALAYVATAGKDPLNDEPLTVDELISIASNGNSVFSPPKPAEFHSIPTMLAAFQNEWDAVALEVFSLRKQLHSTRQELSLALYKYDAAVRVAAKATREKDEAQRALQQISESFASKTPSNGAVESEVADEKGPATENPNPEFSSVIASARASLFALHKSQKIALPVTPKTELTVSKKEQKLTVNNPLNLVINTTMGHSIVTGESNTLLLPEGRESSKFDAVAFLNEAGQASPIGVNDQGIHLLNSDETYSVSIPKTHSIIAHPSEPYFVALTEKNSWVFAGKTGVIHTETGSGPILAADIHVDGALLGVATAGKIEIVDLTTFGVVSSIETGDLARIKHMKFALNGYWLFASGDNVLQVYDLRKSSLVHTFSTEGDVEFAIDASCQVLVVCDKFSQKLSVHLYAKKGKKWMENVHVEDCGTLHNLQIESSAEDIQSSKSVKVTGLSGDQIVHYEIGLK